MISKPITIQGDEDTKIVSLGTPIMISDAENVVLKDLDIEADEVAIIGENVKSLQLKNLQVEQGMGGIQLTDSADIILENVDISGQDGHFSEKGHAVAIYKSKNIQASDCDIWGVLDGFYLERVDGITLSNNRIEEGRYAVHVMYSDNVELIANKATANMTGLMIMIANNVTVHNNQISKNNTLNSLGVYMYDNENIDFQQNILSENTVAMSVEHTRNMDMSNNEFWTNGTAVQVKQSPELQVTKTNFTEIF